MTLLLLACARPDAPISEPTDTGTLPTDDTAPAPVYDGAAGTFHNQKLEVDGEDRRYFLYVPAAYDGTEAWPLLIDFHGTAGATSTRDRVEEYYAYEGMLAAADAARVIVVRPRSLSSEEAGQLVYRWDQNRGDLAKNEVYADALVAELRAHYRIGPLWSAGFSNGTNMAFQLADDDTLGVAAVGAVGGGLWDAPDHLAASVTAVYDATGYRDYMVWYWRDAEVWLNAQGFPAEATFYRETDAGHELYGWHYDELFAWFADGTRPEADPDGVWTPEDAGADASFTELTRAPDGAVLATAGDGSLWRRSSDGGWMSVRDGQDAALLGVCVNEDGTGVAVGEQDAIGTVDGGLTWTDVPAVPDYAGIWGSLGWSAGAGCADGHALVGGYWTAAHTEDGGASWSELSVEAWGTTASAVAFAHDGLRWAAVGYAYAGSAGEDLLFTGADFPNAYTDWLNDVDADPAGGFWAVGEAGGVFRSDDGTDWTAVSPAGTDDLYTIAVAPDGALLVAGVHGAAWLSTDAGVTWTRLPTGTAGFLGGSVWLDETTALVAGEDGSVFRWQR